MERIPFQVAYLTLPGPAIYHIRFFYLLINSGISIVKGDILDLLIVLKIELGE